MRRDQQRLNDILEALDWIAKAIAGRMEAARLSLEIRRAAQADRIISRPEVFLCHRCLGDS
jgi:hypothetical protein